jgi:hypothetical protein
LLWSKEVEEHVVYFAADPDGSTYEAKRRQLTEI